MSDVVPAEDIERIVGVPRHPILHIARAVSAEQTVYILHSKSCLDAYDDLRDCPWSLALDNGIDVGQWEEDAPLAVGILDDRLVPRRLPGGSSDSYSSVCTPAEPPQSPENAEGADRD